MFQSMLMGSDRCSSSSCLEWQLKSNKHKVLLVAEMTVPCHCCLALMSWKMLTDHYLVLLASMSFN